jgi:hypothetical protein
MTKSSGRMPKDAGLPAVAGSWTLILPIAAGIRFIGGAPMKEATKVVAGYS